MTTKLVAYMKSLGIKPDIDQSELEKYFNVRKLKRNEILLSLNSVCRNYYFVNHGALRIDFIIDGLEYTYWFAFENYLFTEFESYNSRTFTHCEIKAIEDSEILEITRKNMELLLSKHKFWQDFQIKSQQQTIIKLTEIIKSFQTQSASDRYADLFHHLGYTGRPDQKDQSTLIGVTKQSLSRTKRSKK
mgnify:CR=1 FL=1